MKQPTQRTDVSVTKDRTTLSCMEGRHGDHHRDWSIEWRWGEENCHGVARSITAPDTGYLVACPCPCHGDYVPSNVRVGWLPSTMSPTVERADP